MSKLRLVMSEEGLVVKMCWGVVAPVTPNEEVNASHHTHSSYHAFLILHPVIKRVSTNKQ
jgi:hypothetical protein